MNSSKGTVRVCGLAPPVKRCPMSCGGREVRLNPASTTLPVGLSTDHQATNGPAMIHIGSIRMTVTSGDVPTV